MNKLSFSKCLWTITIKSNYDKISLKLLFYREKGQNKCSTTVLSKDSTKYVQ